MRRGMEKGKRGVGGEQKECNLQATWVLKSWKKVALVFLVAVDMVMLVVSAACDSVLHCFFLLHSRHSLVFWQEEALPGVTRCASKYFPRLPCLSVCTD